MPKPFRIASICPSNTELLCALGLGPNLVGVDNYSDYPATVVERLPKLGPDLHIDVKQLALLQPDLVVSSLSVPGMEHVVSAVAQAGLHQVVLSPTRLFDIVHDALQIADALPPSLRSQLALEAVRSAFHTRIERIATATSLVVNRPRLYWEWWPTPVFSPGCDNWLTEVSQLAGAQNIFADVPGPQVRDDGSRVCEAQPDVFLAVWTGVLQQKVPVSKITSRVDGWPSTPAFQNHALYVLAEGLYCRPSPRLLDGLEQLVGLLHPAIARELGLALPFHYAPVRTWQGTWLGNSSPTSEPVNL